MNPSVRMNIQRDVVIKYQKTQFGEEAARKARNTALRFFFEYLVDYGLALYKERKATVLESKTAGMNLETRFEGLREVCCNLAGELASKAALSAQVIGELREQIRQAIADYEKGIARDPELPLEQAPQEERAKEIELVRSEAPQNEPEGVSNGEGDELSGKEEPAREGAPSLPQDPMPTSAQSG